MSDASWFDRDLDVALTNKQRRQRNYHTRTTPRLRLLGLAFVAVYMLAWSLWVAPIFDAGAYLSLLGVLAGYAVLSWFALVWGYRPDARIDLALVFYNLDVLVFLTTFAYTGGQEAWMAMFLITRVADQTVVSFRRAWYFAHLNTLSPLALVVYLNQVNGVDINWPQTLAILGMLYLAGLYIALTAHTSQSLRVRTKRAFDKARVSLDALEANAEELKKNSVALGEARQLAQEANAAKSQFLANMSHEIRTPMNGILGTTALLSRSELSDSQRRYTDRIQSSGRTLLAIIDDILDLTKLEARKITLEQTSFDLNETLHDLVELHRAGIGTKDVAVNLSLLPGLPDTIVGDRVRYEQIVGNLLSNAVKFTEAGTISVRAGPHSHSDGAQRLKISVEDTGIGIDADRVEAIFDEFTQADPTTTRRFGGTGLGLAIVRQLVELIGGDVTVESTVGRGSVFSFDLPLVAGDSDAAVRSNTNQTDVPLQVFPDARVLIVDDNIVNREVAIDALSALSCALDVASDGRQAIEMFLNCHYDLIFMDCQMPELDGYEATSSIRKAELASEDANRPRRVPIIAMTANAMEGDRQRCLDAGMDDYASKPIDIDAIAHMAARWITTSRASHDVNDAAD